MEMSMKIRLVAVVSYVAFCGATLAQNKESSDADIIHLVERPSPSLAGFGASGSIKPSPSSFLSASIRS
jgi:hypothetical protein